MALNTKPKPAGEATRSGQESWDKPAPLNSGWKSFLVRLGSLEGTSELSAALDRAMEATKATKPIIARSGLPASAAIAIISRVPFSTAAMFCLWVSALILAILSSMAFSFLALALSAACWALNFFSIAR